MRRFNITLIILLLNLLVYNKQNILYLYPKFYILRKFPIHADLLLIKEPHTSLNLNLRV